MDKFFTFYEFFGRIDCRKATILQKFRMGRYIDLKGLLCVGILKREDECVCPVMMDGRGLRGS